MTNKALNYLVDRCNELEDVNRDLLQTSARNRVLEQKVEHQRKAVDEANRQLMDVCIHRDALKAQLNGAQKKFDDAIVSHAACAEEKLKALDLAGKQADELTRVRADLALARQYAANQALRVGDIQHQLDQAQAENQILRERLDDMEEVEKEYGNFESWKKALADMRAEVEAARRGVPIPGDPDGMRYRRLKSVLRAVGDTVRPGIWVLQFESDTRPPTHHALDEWLDGKAGRF